MLPITWQTFLFGFAAFRLLDIVKPFPISYFDKKVPRGLGVVADDVVAGLLCNIILQVVYTQTTWLGIRLYS
jgi:phosphatidylglycerophosphatase A